MGSSLHECVRRSSFEIQSEGKAASWVELETHSVIFDFEASEHVAISVTHNHLGFFFELLRNVLTPCILTLARRRDRDSFARMLVEDIVGEAFLVVEFESAVYIGRYAIPYNCAVSRSNTVWS